MSVTWPCGWRGQRGVRAVAAPMLAACIGCAGAAGAAGQEPPAPAAGAAAGSTAFCLFELPAEEAGRRRWINLGIVQYVEAARGEVKIAYGGGNLGAGHEARVPLGIGETAEAVLERMRRAAAACR